MAIRFVCVLVILLAEFYAWLMTATGLQLTQYRPAFGGWIGNAQPFVLAALVHAAISLFYLRLASPVAMTTREKVALATSVPLILVFVFWSIFMSSYSIMFERRVETSFVEAGNKLQGISASLHALDNEMSNNYTGVINNLRDRMELEIKKPEPGVLAGCGNRCRTLRRGWTNLQDFQYLNTPTLHERNASDDLAKELSALENDYVRVNDRLEGYKAASQVFIDLNRLMSGNLLAPNLQEDVITGDNTSSQAIQYASRLKEIKRQLDDLRANDRRLTDSKFRGLSELVKDIAIASQSGQITQVLDLVTILLIAMAPDILSLAMAALARSYSRTSEATPMLPWAQMFWRRLMRQRRYMPSNVEIDNLKNLVTEQLRYRVSATGTNQPGTAAPPSGLPPTHTPVTDTEHLVQTLRPHRRSASRDTS